MAAQGFADSYASLLEAFVRRQEEQLLADASELGRALVRSGVPPEEIAEIHEAAIRRLAEASPDKTLLESVSRISAPLIEVLMAYGLAFREQAEQRERAHEALRESEENYRSIFEVAGSMIVAVNPEGVVLDCNRKTQELLGYERPQIIGRPITAVLHSEDVAGFAGVLAETLEKGFCRNRECRMLPAAGPPIDVSLNSAGQKDRRGETARIVCIVTDIRERKRAEEERLRLERQVQQAQKLESLGILTGGIAHDFNNILSAILGYAELAMDQIPEGTRGYDNLAKVVQAADRATDLVNELLTFSKRTPSEKAPLRLQAVVEDTLGLLRAAIPATVEIRSRLDVACGPVVADSAQVRQIVMNLCTNAYQALPGYRGVIEIALDEVNVTGDEAGAAAHRRPGKQARLTVRDDGCGMDEATQARMFEPFFTTKPSGSGTGLGLSVVHGIVEDHGGWIAVESEPGRGTTIQVFFPVGGHDSGETEEAPGDRALPAGRERILFVDDEEMITELSVAGLERLGYEVTACTSSVEALEAFRALPEAYDLVVADQTMPAMTGAELAREMLAVRPDLPIILCSGFSETTSAQEARALGIKEIVRKPVSMKALARILRRVLNGA